MILIKRDTDDNNDNDDNYNTLFILGESLIGVIIFSVILIFIIYKSYLACYFKRAKTTRNNSSVVNRLNRNNLFGFKNDDSDMVANALETRSVYIDHLYNSNNRSRSNIDNENGWKNEDILPKYTSQADNAVRLDVPPQARLNRNEGFPPLYCSPQT